MATKKQTPSIENQILISMQEMQKTAQKLNLSPMQTRGGALAKGVDVCAIYSKIKPVLVLISEFPLIPKKIKDAVKLLMSALDTLCPR